ncbi:MAG: hypothetical protein KAT83_00995 [Candidatus Aenigmarchaeota archaeon]|nr:hypothetical protein [Candidatus Aenigmarchaeota archaeon]
MIAVVGSRDMRIGFGLAGVKNTYKNINEVDGEKIVLLEDVKQEEPVFSADASQIVIQFSLQKKSPKINEKFIRQVIGANVLVK